METTKEAFLKRLSIDPHVFIMDYVPCIEYFLALDGIDIGVMHCYEGKQAWVNFPDDLEFAVARNDIDIQLIIKYQDDIVKFIESHGYVVSYRQD